MTSFLDYALVYKLHLNEWCKYHSAGIRSNIEKDNSFTRKRRNSSTQGV